MKEKIPVPSERIISRIFLIRGRKVMLDRDLALLYGVRTMVLNQAVKRNIKRFPRDFMFQLNKEEAEIISRSQFVILKRGANIKYLPHAFTEQGVAMLSSVLSSERAILVNIEIIRTFTRIRELLASNKKLREKVEEMERKYDQQFQAVFKAIELLIQEEQKPKKVMGFSDKK